MNAGEALTWTKARSWRGCRRGVDVNDGEAQAFHTELSVPTNVRGVAVKDAG